MGRSPYSLEKGKVNQISCRGVHGRPSRGVTKDQKPVHSGKVSTEGTRYVWWVRRVEGCR